MAVAGRELRKQVPITERRLRDSNMAYIDTPKTQLANRRFIRRAMKTKLLEQDHEFELARRWREERDEEALHELVTAYIRLVVAMAARFRNYGLPFGDLIQEGNVGLMQAAERFEPERGVRFSTYVSWWIRSAIQEYILRNWSVVRTGTTASQKSLFFNLRRLRARIAGPGATALTLEARAEIARLLGVREREVEAMDARLSGSDKSLNDPLGEFDDGEWQDFLVDDSPTPEDTILAERDAEIAERDAEIRQRWLMTALSELTEREQTIITEPNFIPRAPLARQGPHARGAGQPPRHQQGAGAPDRARGAR